jgi:hypothetical protein
VSVSGGWKKLQQAGLWPVDTAPQLPYLKKKGGVQTSHSAIRSIGVLRCRLSSRIRFALCFLLSCGCKFLRYRLLEFLSIYAVAFGGIH